LDTVKYYLSGITSITFSNDQKKSGCQNALGRKSLLKQSAGYSPDKKNKISVEADHETEEVYVKLKYVKSGETKILEAIKFEHFGTLGTPEVMQSLVHFSKQRSLAVVSVEGSRNILLFDTSSWDKVGSLGYSEFALSPNGKFLAVSGFNWKFGWSLSIFEIDEKGKGFVVGGRSLIGGMDWCGSADKNGCPKNIITGHCLSDGSECKYSAWYKGQNYGFSEDDNYLVIDALDDYYFAYDLRKKSPSERSCAQ
jgi:hypothetical protein